MITYIAEIGGSHIKIGSKAMFKTIRAARDWAEEFGTTADYCVIMRRDKIVAEHQRDNSGDGTRWYKVPMR